MLTKLETIIKNAAEIMLKMQPKGIVSKEGHANFVTEADKKTQDFLQEELLKLLPGSVMYGEEKENEPLDDKPTWVVDPIDGTLNYIHGIGHSAVAIALAENRQLKLACVYNPYRQELFTAEKGRGAYLNGERISCSDTPYERALTSFGTSPYVPGLVDATFRAVNTLMRETADVRRFGSAILDLANIACGRGDIFFEYSLSPWDYAAGALLIREAGGRFTLLNLPDDRLDFSATAAVFTSNPQCFEKGLEVVERNYREWQKEQGR
ncbi:MAG: inositol monophosphatase family protein [Bacillota bacterium]|nr:inositol monophosphatase family protein [Bacillota bacterium]